MPIDFHAEKNRTLYATRAASPDWAQTIQTIARPEGLRVADIGCEGGIYAAEWTRLGAASVVGIDFSEAMLSAARERNHGLANVIFQQGDALATGLPDRSFDIVFERALIHHLDDLGACFAEAHRLLGAGGRLIIKGRTPDDVALPGSPEHLRGYIFACFPRLLAVEAGRRPRSQDVIASFSRAPDSRASRQGRCGRRARSTPRSTCSRPTSGAGSAALIRKSSRMRSWNLMTSASRDPVTVR